MYSSSDPVDLRSARALLNANSHERREILSMFPGGGIPARSDTEVIRLLRQVYLIETDAEVRKLIMLRLSQYKHVDALDALSLGARDLDRMVRGWMLQSVYHICVRYLGSDDSIAVKAGICQRGAQVVGQLLNDSDPEVREAARMFHSQLQHNADHYTQMARRNR